MLKKLMLLQIHKLYDSDTKFYIHVKLSPVPENQAIK